MRWYTAVGVKIGSWDGTFLVRAGTEIKNLLGVESYIWNTLLWAFVGEGEVYERMLCLLRLSFPEEPEKRRIGLDEFEFAFRRLLQRGLLAFREEETAEEAARELIKSASVACVSSSFGERFLMFCEGFSGGSTFKDSFRVFKKNPLEQTYRQLLKEIQDSKETGFRLNGTENLLEAVIELHRNKLLFIQSVKEGLVA